MASPDPPVHHAVADALHVVGVVVVVPVPVLLVHPGQLAIR